MDRYAIKIPLPDNRPLGVQVMLAEGYLPGSSYIAVHGIGTANVIQYLFALKDHVEEAIKVAHDA